MGWFSQYRLFLQKNLKLKRASKCGTCLECFLPIIVIAVLIGFMQITLPTVEKRFSSPLPPAGYFMKDGDELLYTPNTPEVMQLIDYFSRHNLGAPAALVPTIRGFDTDAAMTQYYQNNSAKIWAGVAFYDDAGLANYLANRNTSDEYYTTPFNVSYAIRMAPRGTPSPRNIVGAGVSSAGTYIGTGWSSLQASLDSAIISIIGGRDISFSVNAAQFDFKPPEMWERYHSILESFNILGPIFIIIALFSSTFRYLTDSVMEKESKIREVMYIMGLRAGVDKFAWFTTIMLITTIPTLIAFGILQGVGIYHYGAASTILFLWFSELFSIISLASLVSLYVTKAKFAGILGFVVALAMCIIGVVVTQEDTTEGVKIVVSLLSPAAFVIGHTNIIAYETNRIGISPKNMNDKVLPDYPSLGVELAMIYLDTLLYAIIAWYIENVFPGEYGLPRHPLFFLQSSYWNEIRGKKTEPKNVFASEDVLGGDVEPVPPELQNKAGVVIQCLRKEFAKGFGKKFAAVDGLDLSMYEGQITAFLGHNGAGKTTTISMLTGLLPVTDGDAYVHGYSIRSQIHLVRKSLGVCPQHDVIWNQLTVYDHLHLYAGLKGVPYKQITKTVKKMITDIGLTEKKHFLAGALSGGQKRKLCLAMSFIGDSDVVFLDEPTSGMDPVTRRSVWDFLNANKAGRVIVLTTHFMDEADFLGDRIAIISHGQLRCAGSSLFLKSRLGVGYLLTMVKKKEANIDAITEFVTSNIQGANLLTSYGGELSFRLPKEAASLFSEFFSKLDQELGKLAIDSYGVSLTTLEEVFLRIGLEDKIERDEEDNRTRGAELTEIGKDQEKTKVALAYKTEGHSFGQQLRALITKRAQVYRRDLRSLFFAFVLPLIFIVLSVVILTLPPNYIVIDTTPAPARLLSLSVYPPEAIDFYTGSVAPLETSPYYVANANKFVSKPLFEFDKFVREYKGVPALGALHLENINVDSLSTGTQYGLEFNETILHGLPIHMNLLHDALLRRLTNGTAGMSVILAPFPLVRNNFLEALASVDILNITYFTLIMFAAFSLIPAGFVASIVQEKVLNIKRLLLVSGATKGAYWVSNFMWDIFLFLLLIVAAIIVEGAGQPDTFDSETLGASALIFIAYALAITTQTYVFSIPFKSYTVVTGAIFAINLLVGFMLNIGHTWVSIRTLTGALKDNNEQVDLIYYLFAGVSPQFALMYSLQRLMGNISVYPRNGRSWYEMNLIGYPLLMLFMHFIFWSLLLVVIEYWDQISGYMRAKMNPHKATRKAAKMISGSEEDQDVAAERQRVVSAEGQDDVVRVIGLRKEYHLGARKKKVAVQNLTLGIPQGQCFGLLGMNGAGKSTTLAALSGDTVPTAGEIYLNSYNLLTDPGHALKYFGWCPQFDALIGNLTGREQLWMYCRIKGLKESVIKESVDAFLKMLDLEYLADRVVGGYSGGNKRKMSLAVAMIGNPPIVFLDEPSTGMDPLARRFMWNVITSLGGNKAVVVTTHSMEECDALTQRIGIMSQGRLVCLGSSQHLKSRFAAGYSLQIKAKPETLHQVRAEIMRVFPMAKLADAHGDMTAYELPQQAGYQLSSIFGLLQHMGQQGWTDDYAVSQTTLEQVFLKLAKEKAEGAAQTHDDETIVLTQ